MRTTERILKALANRRRLAILTYLQRHQRATVGGLADHLKVTLPTTSKHLAILASADLVEYERQSLLVYYRLADDMPAVARALLKHI